MITSTTLYDRGKLANQLFICGVLLAIKYELGYEVKIPDWKDKSFSAQKCLLGDFTLTDNIGILTQDDISKIQYNYFESDLTNKNFENCKFNAGVFWIPDWTNIYGWFQNYQYFEKHEKLIIPDLMPKKHIMDYNNEIFNQIKSLYTGYEIVSLHLRKGDIQNYGPKTKMYGEDPDILDTTSLWYQYFVRAKRFFKNKKVKFLVFSGGLDVVDAENFKTDIDYEWCKRNLNGEDFIYYDYERSTVNDFALMTLCDHHILSPSSSFSTLIGIIGSLKDKIIIAPRKTYFLIQEYDYGYYPYNVILV